MLATVGSSFRLKHFVRTDEKYLHVYLTNSYYLFWYSRWDIGQDLFNDMTKTIRFLLIGLLNSHRFVLYMYRFLIPNSKCVNQRYLLSTNSVFKAVLQVPREYKHVAYNR